MKDSCINGNTFLILNELRIFSSFAGVEGIRSKVLERQERPGPELKWKGRLGRREELERAR